ncbi:MAG: alpha/beta hydrolase [Pseudomonadota bacterium]
MRILNRILRLTVRRRLERGEFSEAMIRASRARLNRMGARLARRKAGQVEYLERALGGVPTIWTLPKLARDPLTQEDSETPVVLYCHGGGYLVGSPGAWRGITANLAAASHAAIAAIDYALAPERPYPAAHQDALAAYRALLDAGVEPARIAIGGDSAGGNLALATLHNIRAARLPMPSGAVLLSPWLDLTSGSPSIQTLADHEAMLPPGRLSEAASHYAGDAPLASAEISPLFGDQHGLPPLTLHVGAHEVLRDDSRRLREQIDTAGGEIDYHEWPHAPHVFPAFADVIPEGAAAMRQIGGWLQTRFAAATTDEASG